MAPLSLPASRHPPSPTSPPQLRRGDETECCRRHDLYIKTPENPGGNERLCEKREEREREAARTEYKKLNEKGQEMKFSLPSEYQARATALARGMVGGR